MKKYRFVLCMLVAMITGFASLAQECGYYPVRNGAVMGYQSLDAKGKITGTSKVTMLDVVQSGAATLYKVKAEYWDEKNKPQPAGEYTMKCDNGVLAVDMKSMIDPKSLEGFKDMEITFSGNDLTFPSRLIAGQTLPDASITIAAASGGMTLMKMTVTITNRKVEGVENVTVPAGTFECYKISYDLETKMGIKVTSTAIQWMNKGAGSVRTETYDKKGKLTGSTVLNQFQP